MSDIYKAPESELTAGEESGEYGSLEKGLAGDYAISAGDIISEAWRRIKGHKGTVWLGVLLYLIAAGIITYISGLITGYPAFDPEEAANVSVTASLLHQVIVTAVSAPIVAGMLMIGIKIARDETVSGTEVFSHFDKIVPLVVCNVLMSILIVIGFALLILPGIYLAVAYILAIPLIVDKGLGPWQALETSRKAITKHWFPMFGFLLLCLLIYVVGILAVLIGLIWAIPTVAVAYGIVYRKVFGTGPENA